MHAFLKLQCHLTLRTRLGSAASVWILALSYIPSHLCLFVCMVAVLSALLRFFPCSFMSLYVPSEGGHVHAWRPSIVFRQLRIDTCPWNCRCFGSTTHAKSGIVLPLKQLSVHASMSILYSTVLQEAFPQKITVNASFVTVRSLLSASRCWGQRPMLLVMMIAQRH